MLVEQGDVLRIDRVSHPVLVVSNNFFNESGAVIGCPITKNASMGPLHIKIDMSGTTGVVLCEQVKFFDLHTRGYAKHSSIEYYSLIDISDAIQGMFEYI